jgi:glycosyltransferase involved in cell wall biosynthesis
MPPIRVCHLITELAPAGAERCVYELARRMDPERVQVEVAALRGGQVAGWLEQEGIPVHLVNMRGKWDLLKLWKLSGLLRPRRFDLLHTHLFHGDLAGRPARAMAGIPHLVHTLHVAEGRFRPWQFAYARMFSDQADRIICVSHAVKEFHARRSGIPDGHYEVIPNGIDPDAYARDASARQRLRRQWGIGEGEILLTHVGRLDQQKGIDVLLGALSHLASRGKGAKIVLAGSGPLEPMVRNYISHGEGGRLCRSLGFVQDVRSVFSAADIAVMPSRYEGFPLTALEAMAAGLPVIGTDVAGLSEAVEDEQTGLLVESEDSIALAEAISDLQGDADARARMGQAGVERVRAHFHIQSNVARHAQLYQEVCEGQGG